MDVTEDTRLQELKQALAAYPQEQTKVESKSITSWDINDLSGIAALTTLDLTQLTSSSISAFSNTSVTLGNPVTWTSISGGGGSGGSGQVYTGGGALPNVYTLSGTTGTATNAIWGGGGGVMKINADDVEINGKSLMTTLNRIEERLAILDCVESLEQEWNDLRELGIKYRELQQHIEAKMKTFNSLKQ